MFSLFLSWWMGSHILLNKRRTQMLNDKLTEKVWRKWKGAKCLIREIKGAQSTKHFITRIEKNSVINYWYITQHCDIWNKRETFKTENRYWSKLSLIYLYSLSAVHTRIRNEMLTSSSSAGNKSLLQSKQVIYELCWSSKRKRGSVKSYSYEN